MQGFQLLKGMTKAAVAVQLALAGALPWPFYAFWAVGYFGLAAMEQFDWGTSAPSSGLPFKTCNNDRK